MKKILLSILALMLSAGMWAQTQTQTQRVSYLYPVYNTTDDPKSGIKEWKEGSVEATVIAGTVSLKTGWYVVLGNDVKTRGMTCMGDVHLILADGAKLTTNAVGASTGPGLTVKKDDGSLTIYGQAAQSGQLIAKGKNGDFAGIGGSDSQSNGKITINGGIIEATGNSSSNRGGAGIGGGGNKNGSDITINGGIVTATGAYRGAGIGGGYYGSGSNITINGGTVTAYGGTCGAGIGGGYNAEGSGITINGGTVTAIGKGDSSYAGAGIGGGGLYGSGSNITINGGIVIASGCWVDEDKRNSDGIGCGNGGNLTPTNIKVTSTHEVKADNNNPPSTMIENDGSEDLASKLKGQRYVTITPSLETEKVYAIAAINAKLEEIDNGIIKGIASIAIASINATTSVVEVNTIKTQALSNIAAAKGAYYNGKTEGYEEGKAEAFDGMDTPPLTDCPAVKVTKGEKVVILYAPEKVEMIKIPANN